MSWNKYKKQVVLFLFFSSFKWNGTLRLKSLLVSKHYLLYSEVSEGGEWLTKELVCRIYSEENIKESLFEIQKLHLRLWMLPSVGVNMTYVNLETETLDVRKTL